MNPLENLNRERNPISENISYLFEKKCLCPHGKLHPLTARKGEYISATMHRYLESIIMQESQINISHQENEVPATQR